MTAIQITQVQRKSDNNYYQIPFATSGLIPFSEILYVIESYANIAKMNYCYIPRKRKMLPIKLAHWYFYTTYFVVNVFVFCVFNVFVIPYLMIEMHNFVFSDFF